MRKVALFSLLLIAGLVLSQLVPGWMGEHAGLTADIVRVLTTTALAFIMIHVGFEFDVDKTRLRSYGWDYVVAMTAAAFPWVFVTGYFVLVLMPEGAAATWAGWSEALLAGRFAAPTSAGVLFSMLAAAGLSATWVFRKARILAIFDDLDTVLLMVVLKVFIIGPQWQLGVILVLMVGLLWAAWRWLHAWRIPISWRWVLGYGAAISIVSELIYAGSTQLDDTVPIHIEVLLPAFVLGCVMARPAGSDPHSDDAREGHQEGPESPEEQRVSTVISAVFMVLVGLSMPQIVGRGDVADATTLAASMPMPGWGAILLHVLAITVISNLGKMFPALCYRAEAGWRERLGLAIGLWPRGEVGAGVLIVSLSYGMGGPVLVVAMLSLVLNLVLTGGFIWIVKRLVAVPEGAPDVTADLPAS